LTPGPLHPLLDAVNRRVLAELAADPRLPMTELARRVGLSSPSVTERVRRLEEAGVIRGYRLEVDPRALGYPLLAYVRVRPNPGQLPRVADLAREIPEVLECHRVTGEDCFVVKLLLPEMAQLDRVLDQFLRFGTTTTSIVQTSPVQPRTPPLPE
jgi:Lrp/AsnC family leucine-responsive transcriptional regulator